MCQGTHRGLCFKSNGNSENSRVSVQLLCNIACACLTIYLAVYDVLHPQTNPGAWPQATLGYFLSTELHHDTKPVTATTLSLTLFSRIPFLRSLQRSIPLATAATVSIHSMAPVNGTHGKSSKMHSQVVSKSVSTLGRLNQVLTLGDYWLRACGTHRSHIPGPSKLESGSL